MAKKWQGLVETVQKFKNTVKSELDKENGPFHAELNGDEPLIVNGLVNEYRIDTSDVLFWGDPVGYLDELDQWNGQTLQDKHQEAQIYLKTSGQINVFSRLVEAMKKNRIAPFVGAGFSRPSGYPMWGEALIKLYRKLEAQSSSDEKSNKPPLAHLDIIKKSIDELMFIEAAELLYEHHNTQLYNFIFNEFDGAKSKKIFGPITLLPRFANSCIITTNFDELIETVFEKENKPISGYMHGTQTQNQFASKLIQGERCILKLHGNYSNQETYIFSKTQYDAAYGSPTPDYSKPLSRTLRQIYISHSLLFLGCSLEQDRTLEVFKNIVDAAEFEIPEHYALLPEPKHAKIAKENFLDSVKVKPIWYEVKTDESGATDHSMLEKILAFAVDCASGLTTVQH